MAKTTTTADKAQNDAAVATIKKTDLEHLHEIDIKINQFEKDYKGLTIVDESDKEGYEKVRLALGDMRPTRTSLDAQRKSVTEPYRMAAAFINDRYNEKIERIKSIEEPLKAKKEEIDAIKKKREEEEELEKERKFNKRIDDLKANGCYFDEAYYVMEGYPLLGISEVSIGVVDVRAMSDELFATWLEDLSRKNNLIQADKDRLQKLKEEEEEDARRKQQEEKEKLEKEQRELAAEKEKMKNDRIEARSELLEGLGAVYVENAKAWVVENFPITKESVGDASGEEWKQIVESVKSHIVANKEKQKKEKTLSERHNALTNMGFIYSRIEGIYRFENISVKYIDEVCDYNEDAWNALIESIKPQIKAIEEERENQRKAAEQKREQEIKDKAIAEENERKRIAEENRLAELAKESDKKKWDDYVSRLKEVFVPEMKNTTYKNKMTALQDYISKL